MQAGPDRIGGVDLWRFPRQYAVDGSGMDPFTKYDDMCWGVYNCVASFVIVA